MALVQALGHVVVKVRDVQRSEEFYGKTLGIPVASRIAAPVPMVFFTLGRHHDFAVVQLGRSGPAPDRHTAGLAHVAFKVGDSLEEFDAAKRHVEAAGVVILFEQQHTSSKGMHMHDPDGNEIELYVDLPAGVDASPLAVTARRLQASQLVRSDELAGCIIVSGMPGAGKSTITALAARLLPKAAQVKGDDVNQMIKSGRVWFMGEPKDEARRQDELCNRNMCALAANFVDCDFTVFMDTVVADRAELDFLLALLAPRPVRLVTLAPGIATCKHRNATRDPDEHFEFDGYEGLDAEMKRELGDIGWWFDTAALTPEATAEQLVREVIERVAPLHARSHTRPET